jgi:hypothetical protein
VKTKIIDNVQYGLYNLTLEVKREVPMNFGNEEHVLGDDEMTNTNGTYHEETHCNADVVMPTNDTLVIEFAFDRLGSC